MLYFPHSRGLRFGRTVQRSEDHQREEMLLSVLQVGQQSCGWLLLQSQYVFSLETCPSFQAHLILFEKLLKFCPIFAEYCPKQAGATTTTTTTTAASSTTLAAGGSTSAGTTAGASATTAAAGTTSAASTTAAAASTTAAASTAAAASTDGSTTAAAAASS